MIDRTLRSKEGIAAALQAEDARFCDRDAALHSDGALVGFLEPDGQISGEINYGVIRTGSGGMYAAAFTKKDFEFVTGQYRLLIALAEHSAGYNAHVCKFERLCGGDYGNVIYQYKQMVNGDMVFYLDEPIDGRLIVKEGI